MKKAILPLILSISIILFYAEEKNYLNQLFKENITVKTDNSIDKEDIEIKSISTNNENNEAHFLITYQGSANHVFKHKKTNKNEDYFYTFKVYEKNNTTLLDVVVKNVVKEHYTSIFNTSSGKNLNLWP